MKGVRAGDSLAQIRSSIDTHYGTRHATPTPWPPGK